MISNNNPNSTEQFLIAKSFFDSVVNRTAPKSIKNTASKMQEMMQAAGLPFHDRNVVLNCIQDNVAVSKKLSSEDKEVIYTNLCSNAEFSECLDFLRVVVKENLAIENQHIGLSTIPEEITLQAAKNVLAAVIESADDEEITFEKANYFFGQIDLLGIQRREFTEIVSNAKVSPQYLEQMCKFLGQYVEIS